MTERPFLALTQADRGLFLMLTKSVVPQAGTEIRRINVYDII